MTRHTMQATQVAQYHLANVLIFFTIPALNVSDVVQCNEGAQLLVSALLVDVNESSRKARDSS